MLVFQSQEKLAVAILLLVIVVCLAGTVLLDGMGKEQFSKEYTPGMADGTLVRFEGVVGSVYHAAGGSQILDVSGVSIFIPASAGGIPDIQEGNRIKIIGAIQHWKGKEEILVEEADDITLVS